MIPTSFKYKRATSVEDAISSMNDDSKILAGGHSLIPAMKLRLNQPGTLIDISKLSDLRFIKEAGNAIVIGAASTHHDIVKSDLVKANANIMSAGADMIGDIQVRNRGTIGGSIAHADPAADWPAILIACNAAIRVQSSGGSRDIAADDFFTGFYETALADGELITEIHVPKQGANTVGVYTKFPQPASRFAIVGCAVVLTKDSGTINNANIAFNGVSDHAFRDKAVEEVINGKAINVESISSASNSAAEGVDVLSDPYASEAYRKHLAKVFCKRALEECK